MDLYLLPGFLRLVGHPTPTDRIQGCCVIKLSQVHTPVKQFHNIALLHDQRVTPQAWVIMAVYIKSCQELVARCETKRVVFVPENQGSMSMVLFLLLINMVHSKTVWTTFQLLRICLRRKRRRKKH